MGQDFLDTQIREKERAQMKCFVQGHIVELSVMQKPATTHGQGEVII